jgi:predicted O-linked N-acetylglucosamine transferase (SPINDLY family)
LLSAAGLSELAAAGDDDYVRIACELAGNSARLSMLRASLRDQVMHSAICDQATYGKTWSAAIEASLGAV